MIPILIRTRNRVEYLYITLKSLTGTNLYNSQIIICDDCSDDKNMKKFLFSNDLIDISSINWKNEIIKNDNNYQNDLKMFDKYLYDLPNINNKIKGIKDKFSVISPNERMGDKNGLLWTIYVGFNLFSNTDYIIIIEDDLLFNKNWLKITKQINQENKNVGIISVYNRNFDTINNEKLFFDVENIGGVMYFIPRNVFNLMLNENIFNLRFDSDNNISGDVFFYEFVKKYKLRLINSTTSYIQHIGVKSICREGRFLRYSKNFLRPYAWNEDFDK